MTETVVRGRSEPLDPGGDAAAGFLSGLLAETGWQPDGLYVATSDGGARESIEFWRAARETGLAFANPRAFPWTLANSPTGQIAKALDVRGPIYTFVGGSGAHEAALEQAHDDLAVGLVTQALVVAHDRSDEGAVVAEAQLVGGIGRSAG